MIFLNIFFAVLPILTGYFLYYEFHDYLNKDGLKNGPAPLFSYINLFVASVFNCFSPNQKHGMGLTLTIMVRQTLH